MSARGATVWRGSGAAGRGLIPGRVSIHERPAIVESRRRFGDWEGDLVAAGKGGGAVATLVERKSRYLQAQRLAGKHADPAAAALAALLAALPQAWRRTLTLDNGKEFSRFQAIEEAIGISVYFADPYAAWQRGANENSNGLLRQYLPKGIDMSRISDATLADAIDRINNRPRKCLGYKTPSEILQNKIGGALGCGI
jgi:IS30 family transposase